MKQNNRNLFKFPKFPFKKLQALFITPYGIATPECILMGKLCIDYGLAPLTEKTWGSYSLGKKNVEYIPNTKRLLNDTSDFYPTKIQAKLTGNIYESLEHGVLSFDLCELNVIDTQRKIYVNYRFYQILNDMDDILVINKKDRLRLIKIIDNKRCVVGIIFGLKELKIRLEKDKYEDLDESYWRKK